MGFLKAVVVAILTLEARAALRRYHPRVIAVTGSMGKTTTKDAIFAAISHEYRARKSEKSTNTEIGVPLAILGLENAWGSPFGWLANIVKGLAIAIYQRDFPTWLVLEVGADRPGDIERIARWLRPDVSVITGVPDVPAHIEFFSSADAVFREKRKLAEYVRPGGTILVNGDDVRARSIEKDFRGLTATYGLETDCDYSASHIAQIVDGGVPLGLQFRLNHAGSSVPAAVYGALGRPRVYAAACALAVANIVGVDLVSATKGLADWVPPPGRMRLISGVRGALVIDDTYNSSPAAALAALDALKSVKSKRRIAVLGDMLELGRYTKDAHREVGARAAKCADMVITVGLRARDIAEAALDGGLPESAVFQYERDESARAGDELEEKLGKGDVVLVKGSQSMRMERAVLEIMAEPARAAELLVRMEPEWELR